MSSPPPNRSDPPPPPAGGAPTLPLPPSPPAQTLDLPAETLALGTAEACAAGTLATSGAATPAELPKRIGRFEVLRFLGEGAFGRVYEANDPQLDRRVALKVAKPEMFGTPDRVKRFLREARSAAGLRHQGIVPVFDSGKEGDALYIASAFIAGRSLDHSVAENPQGMPWEQAARLVQRTAEALGYAHSKGVVHRDVKPANVMLDETGEPLVMDFGLAAREEAGEEKLSTDGAAMGTAAYMAPEQGRGEAVAASDQYSLGCMLFELLTGQLPFAGGGTAQLMFLHATQPPPSPRKLRRDVPRDLETICLKCLEKEPGDRYASTLGLAQDLGRFQAGEPILARREGLLRKMRRHARKRLALLAVVLVALVATGAALWVVLESAASRESAAAVRQFDDRLESLDGSDAERDEIERLADRLAAALPAQGEEARRKLTARVATQIREVLQHPRITAEDITRLEASANWLARRDSELGSQLRIEMAGRFRDWQPLLDLAPPFAGSGAAFPPRTIRVDASGMHRADSAQPVVPTTLPSRGNVRVTVEFGGDWQDSRRMGVVVHHPGGGTPAEVVAGYSFTVVPAMVQSGGEGGKPVGRSPEPASLPTFRRAGLRAELRIARNGTVLQRRVVTLPPGSVRILAEREGSSLRAQVNDLPAITFDDPVPMTGNDRTVLAIVWPGSASVVRMRVEGSALPPSASPLEKADELYDRGQLADALALYLEQARSGGSFEGEARCKVGFCLTESNRTEEAARTYEQVMGMPGERWPVVAAAQLWLLRLRQKQFADADAVFAVVSVRFTRDQLAQYVPASVREELEKGQEFPLVNFLFPDPKMIPKLEAIVRIAELLQLQDSGDGYAGSLALALTLNREYTKAIPYADRWLRHELAYFDPKTGVNEGPFWGLRWACWNRRARGDAKGAAQVAERLISEWSPKPETDPKVAANMRAAVLPFRLEQCRCLAGLGKWSEAEAAVDDYLREGRRPILNYTFYSQPYLLKGFLLARKGDESGAQKIWKQGTYPAYLAQLPPENRPTEHVPPASWGILDHWIMSSLTDTLPDQDAAALSTALFARMSSDALMSQLTNTIQSSPAVIRGTWRSPRGREFARRMAFMETEPLDFFRLPPVVLVYEKFRQELFAGKPTDAQDEACWQGLSRASKLVFSGKLSKTQFLQLGMAWKGSTGIFGWAGAAPGIPQQERAFIGYLMGVRYLKLNKPNDARSMFRKAATDADAGSPVRPLLEEELKRLDAKK